VTITWEAPAGGLWELDTLHLAGAAPRLFQERSVPALRAGFQSASRRYGLPIDHLQFGYVNDHCYARMAVVGAPDPKPGKVTGPPPAPVLWLLARVHPELRRRAKTARAALASKLWLDDVRRWETTLRDEFLEADRALAAEPVAELGDDELLDHLTRAADRLARGMEVHFDLIPAHNVTVGRLVLACRRWGIADADALALLAGSSPASTASIEALAKIGAACRAAGVDPQSLDDVRDAGPDAEAALDAYLAEHAWRSVTQYTPRGLTLVEMPDLLVHAIRQAEPAGVGDAPDATAVRTMVPESDRDHFDELLGEARRCYGVRDDNVALTWMWPVGLVRRALLEVGGRLTARGGLDADWHTLALSEAELAAALRGDSSLREVARARVEHGIAAEAAGAPRQLGWSEGGEPDLSIFPAAMAELTETMIVTAGLEDAVDRDAARDWTGEGVGIGDAPYTGRACVAASVEEALSRLEPGDVLVTSMTTPAYEAVLPIAGAVVTEQGGLISHAALVAREHGIPAVVAVTGATTAIPDGAQIEVDPVAGRVGIR
jgi:phosphohistidine swiveling domain-containing protein